MAVQIGNLVNFNEISSTLGISVKTLKEYLWYLEKTFIVQRISPYFKNVRKEITKSPLFYFCDLGLRNFAAGVFGNMKDTGFIFQNYIFNILREKTRISSSKICFWRTKDKAEVDFVLDSGKAPIPIEVKYKKLAAAEIPRALRSFIERYKPEKALIINLNLDTTSTINQTKILIMPFYKIIESGFFN